VPSFRLACLAYLCSAVPSSILGLLWPSIRLSYHQPLAALGGLLALGIAASVLASAVTGRLLQRLPTGSVVALGAGLVGVALAVEALSPYLLLFAVGVVLFGLGFGGLDAALNAYAAQHFGARRITWMHASYGVGATAGPVLATVMLSQAITWRWVYGLLAVPLVLLAVVFAATGRVWLRLTSSPHSAHEWAPQPPRRRLAVVGSLVFITVEDGIESAAGIWSYVYLVNGRGFSPAAAGLTVSAYWAMMFLGRVVLGALAERIGASRVLAAAVVGLAVGAAVMAVPGPRFVAVLGLMTLGLAAAPIFPLFTLTTADRLGADVQRTTQAVSFQVAASGVGGAVLPAGVGLAITAYGGRALAVPLLGLSLLMCGVYTRLAAPSPGPPATRTGERLPR
jgi:fucose permease